jgi:hypothetical protein
MPIFKYTVANREGKKLSGTVEANDEQTARTELNNLGFSIFHLEETLERPKIDKSLTLFTFEAIDKNSKLISGTIPASNEEDAYKKLHAEYSLTVTAIWKDGATEDEIETARKKGTQKLQEKLITETGIQKERSLEKEKKEQFTNTKVEYTLKEVNDLLKSLDKEIGLSEKAEINKRINKLLRIKHSKNVDYILATAEELLNYIQSLEQTLKTQGYEEKRLELQIKSKKLLSELNKTSKPKTLSEDILGKIENWEKSHKTDDEKPSTNLIEKILSKIKSIFFTPKEFVVIKDQIKVYNKQLFEFAKLYLKEPTPEYKLKVKNSIKTIWATRKKAIHSLKQAKKLLKIRRKGEKIKEEAIVTNFVEELNALTGWLVGFYFASYFISLYITTKDFGLTSIPKGFFIYDSRLFKYILATLFLLHAATSLKVNFFKKNIIADIALPVIFIFGSIVVLLNF